MQKKLLFTLLISTLFLNTACGGTTGRENPADSNTIAAMDTPDLSQPEAGTADYGFNTATGSIGSVDENSEPAKLLSRLEKAYLNSDLYEIAQCFDPSIMNAYFASMKLLGFDPEAIKEMMPFASALMARSGMSDPADWGTVQLIPLDYMMDGLSGSITYQVNLDYPDGTAMTLEDTAAIVNRDGTWYFALVQQTKSGDYGPIPVTPNLTEEDVANGLFPYAEDGLTGYLNWSGQVMIEPYFQSGKTSTCSYYPVKMGGYWGFMDSYGHLVAEYGFEDVGEDSPEGYWPVKRDGKWGYINFENGNIIPCDYSDYGYFSNGIAPVCMDGYWGAVDESGRKAVDFIYDDMTAGYTMFEGGERALSFISGVIGVKVNGAVGVIKADGDYLIPLCPDGASVYFIGDDFVAMQKSSTNQMVNSPENYLFRISTEHKISAPDYYAVIGAVGDTIYLHSAIGSGIPGSNAIAVDVNGTIILDTVQSIYSPLGIDTGYLPRTGFGPSSFQNWTEIYLYTSGGHTQIRNYVNENGALMFPIWMTSLSFSESYAAGCSVDGDITYLYHLPSGETAQYPGCYRLCGDDLLVKSNEANASQEICVINIKTGESITANACGQLSDWAIPVTDGIFYGLYTANGFVGEGIKYNNIQYDTSSGAYSMSIGAETAQYRIGRDGTIHKV